MTALALGTGMIGGHKRRFEQAEANAMFDAAWDRGIRHFDTATLYGLGRAHQLLSQWIRSHRNRRDEMFISTKIARYLVNPDTDHPYDSAAWPGGNPKGQILDYSRPGAEIEIQEALRSLGLDHTDALYVHDIDTQNHGDAYPALLDKVMEGAWPAVKDAKHRHETREIGIGVNNWEPAVDMMKRGARFDSMVLAGRYTLLDQSSLETFLPMALEHKVKVYLGGALNSGILVHGDTETSTYNYVPITDENLKKRVHALKSFADDHDVPLPALALQFAAAHPAVERIILGPNSVEELHQNVDWFELPIAQKTWQELAASGLIDKRAPVPSATSAPTSPQGPSL